MFNRRDILKAVAVQALAFPSAAAWAQSRPKRTAKKKKDSSSNQTVQVDERINRVLAAVRDEYHLPGLIGAILMGNRLAAIGALGIRKIGSSQPIQVTDRMHMGSCTKAMTATVIGSLVEEGKLSWKSTIKKVFPESMNCFTLSFRL